MPAAIRSPILRLVDLPLHPLPLSLGVSRRFPHLVLDASMEKISEFVPFDPAKRKKKKKIVARHAANDPMSKVHLNDGTADDKGEEGISQLVKCRPWEGSERDYHYQELLGRAYNLLNENSPELGGNRRRTFMKPVQVIQEGNMRTVIVNFIELCNIMHRQPDEVVAFMLGKIGADGYVDELQRLIVEGGFPAQTLEEILCRYVDEYVRCSTCRSPDTILSTGGHDFVLGCEQCGFVQPVAPINSGYAAKTRQKRHLKTPGV